MVSAARRRVVYRVLKNAISDNRYRDELDYWVIKVSDQQAQGVISEEQAEELYALAESRMPEDEVEETPAEEVVIEPETTPEPTYTEETSW